MGNAETRSVTKPNRATCLTFGSQARVVLRGSVNDELNGFRLQFFRQDPVGQLKFSYRFDCVSFAPLSPICRLKNHRASFPPSLQQQASAALLRDPPRFRPRDHDILARSRALDAVITTLCTEHALRCVYTGDLLFQITF
jgi:hypothetical protein